MRLRKLALWCAVGLGAAFIGWTAWGTARSMLGLSCAGPPARPIGVEQAHGALERHGIRITREGCDGGPAHVVTALRASTDGTTIFCDVEKSPSPRRKDNPKTIFEGKGTLGHGYDLAFANIDCTVYGDDEFIVRVRHALVSLGGERTEPF